MTQRIFLGVSLALWSALSCAGVIKTIQAGATDQTVVIKIINATDGTPETGVVFNTSGLDLEYWRHGANSVVDITEVTQTVSGAHTDGGFVHLGNGYYRLDLPDAAVAAGATAVEVMGTVPGMIVIGGTVQLSPPVNVVSFGGTAVTGRDIGASVLLSSGTGTGQVLLSSGVVAANAVQLSGDSGAADALEAAFDGTAGGVAPLGIARQGTAQSATSTTLVLDSAASFADDVPIGMTLVACGSTQGYCQARVVTDYTGSSDTATVDAWTVTPSGTITYYLFGTAPSSGGGGLDAAGIRAAIGLSSANLDTQLATIDSNVDSILDDTGTSGVVVASSSKTGYSIGSGGITSASFASGAITAAAVATDAIGAAELASDAVTEIQSGLATASALTTVDSVVDAIKVTTDKLDDTLEDNSGTYRFTEAALAQAPAGEGGGGGTDWDADERAAIRSILGIPVSGSTPADPSSGILDTIRDGITGLNDLSSEDVQSAVESALDGQTCDEPTGKPSWGSSTMKEWVCWIGAWSRNKVQQTSTTKTLRNDADDAAIVTCGVSDDGTTFTLNECTP
jgi:hypothetical protein